jgi:hypothetical protein
VTEPPKAEPTHGIGIDEPVPKLPRGRGMKFSGPEMFRIGLMVVTLIGVLLLTKPCANAVSGFVTSFDGSGSAKEQAMPKPGNVDMPRADQQYEQLKPGMTEAEIKAAVERSKARNAGSAASASSAAGASGSAAATRSGSAGSATGSAGSATGSATP